MARRFLHCILPPGWEKKCGLGSYWNRTGTAQRRKTMKHATSIESKHNWQSYFERFGCVVCSQKSSPHDRGGFCLSCRKRVMNQLRTILRETR